LTPTDRGRNAPCPRGEGMTGSRSLPPDTDTGLGTTTAPTPNPKERHPFRPTTQQSSGLTAALKPTPPCSVVTRPAGAGSPTQHAGSSLHLQGCYASPPVTGSPPGPTGLEPGASTNPRAAHTGRQPPAPTTTPSTPHQQTPACPKPARTRPDLGLTGPAPSGMTSTFSPGTRPGPWTRRRPGTTAGSPRCPPPKNTINKPEKARSPIFDHASHRY